MTDKPVKVSQDIITMAREAKGFIAASGEDSISDDLLMRAAVTFNMLHRRGMIAAVRHDDHMCKPHDFDNFDRAHAVALIAHNFDDDPPSTPERTGMGVVTELKSPGCGGAGGANRSTTAEDCPVALFATVLPDDYGKALQEAVAGNRRTLGLPPQEST